MSELKKNQEKSDRKKQRTRSSSYLVADLMDHHHGELHLVGGGGNLHVQQDLLLHEDVQTPVLHGGVRMFGHRQQICSKHRQRGSNSRLSLS